MILLIQISAVGLILRETPTKFLEGLKVKFSIFLNLAVHSILSFPDDVGRHDQTKRQQ